MSGTNATMLPCTTSTFANMVAPFGTNITGLTAQLVQNYTAGLPNFNNPNHGDIPRRTVSFCNLTITTTHPGVNDAVSTQVWLPADPGWWNGRMQAVGGAGFLAGLFGFLFRAMDGALGEGYAVTSTNAGSYATDVDGGDTDWALLSPGNVDLHLVRNFAETSLYEMGMLAKEAVGAFYGEPPRYSYFSGCSNGGRQGLVLAQRYPGLFDGIAASAPAIYFDEAVEYYWMRGLMQERGVQPLGCEYDALRKAMLDSCDKLDGIEDGILQDPAACSFDANSMVGNSIECEDEGVNSTVSISQTAADIASGLWDSKKRPSGIRYQGDSPGYDADLKEETLGGPNPLRFNFMRTFIKKDRNWNDTNLTLADIEKVRLQGTREYRSFLGISDYDLSGFQAAGSKMIAFHGTADPTIPYGNTLRFYKGASAYNPSLSSSYRVFLAPGLGHCVGGPGAYPNTTFHALVDWVENGIAPDELRATSIPDETGHSINRILCAWPKKAVWDGVGNVDEHSSWSCAE